MIYYQALAQSSWAKASPFPWFYEHRKWQLAALGYIIDLKFAKKLRTDKKISLIEIAISSPKTGSQFIVKFSVAALRTVLFLTTEWSYIFVHPRSCFERLYILHRCCVQQNSRDEANFIFTGTFQNTAFESLSFWYYRWFVNSAVIHHDTCHLIQEKHCGRCPDIHSSTGYHICSKESIYPSTVY